MEKLSRIIKFSRLLQDFSKIERVILKRGENKWENDSEHSYGLTMLAWYILETDKLKLKKDLVLKYALVHDLVEVYAGDTYLYASANRRKTKATREKKAAQKIKKEFPEFRELHSLINDYEKLKNQEAKFIYALDKIIPLLNIYTDNGRTWKKKNITIKMLIEAKEDKIALAPDLKEYFWGLIEILEKEKARLFNK